MNHKYIIQSVLFPTDIFSIEEAKAWLEEHKLKNKKVDMRSIQFTRWRQISPEVLKKKGYTKYFTYKLKNGVEYIVSFKIIK